MRRETITQADIEAGYQDDRWLGHGYLGTRRLATDTSDPEATVISPERLAEVDAIAIAVANEKRWTKDQFFDWLNSKPGRWFAESQFFGPEGTRERDTRLTMVLP